MEYPDNSADAGPVLNRRTCNFREGNHENSRCWSKCYHHHEKIDFKMQKSKLEYENIFFVFSEVELT